jgi:hypothetical protein
MFGRNNNESRPDYYADDNGRVYSSNDFNKKSFSPVWLLPILLIPLGLLLWGGFNLFKNDTNQNTGALSKITSPTPASVNTKGGGLEVGVGGAPNDPTSTPAATSKATATPTKKPTPKAAKTEVGVGGGPDDPSVPSMPATGHGW